MKLVFEADDGLLAGTMLTDFSIMRGKEGPFVSVPSRQYTKDGEKRYWNMLRAADKDDTSGLDRLKEAILAKFNGN